MGFVCVGVSWVASSGKWQVVDFRKFSNSLGDLYGFAESLLKCMTSPTNRSARWKHRMVFRVLTSFHVGEQQNELCTKWNVSARETCVLTELSRTVRRLGLKTKAFNFSCPEKKTFSPRIFHSTMERFSLLLNIHELSWFEHDLFIWRNSICWVLGGGNVRRQFIATDMSANWNGWGGWEVALRFILVVWGQLVAFGFKDLRFLEFLDERCRGDIESQRNWRSPPN